MISITLLPTSQPIAAEGADGQPLPQPTPFAGGPMAGQPQPEFGLAELGEHMPMPHSVAEDSVGSTGTESSVEETMPSIAAEVEQALAGQWLQGTLEQRNAVVEVRGGLERAEPRLDPLRTLERLVAGGEQARLLAAPSMPGNGPLTADGLMLSEAVFAAGATQQAGAGSLSGGPLEAQPLATASTAGALQSSPAIEQTLKLGAAEPKWGQQMLHAVRNSIDVQIRQGVQNASIRLDPPELGRLDIAVTTENGRLSIQISAAHTDVARLLHQTSERLRQELMAENFVHVNVEVASDSQPGRDGQSQPRTVTAFGDAVIGVNGAEAAVESSTGTRPIASDVLVTV